MSESFERKYFAASNSAAGFRNYFGDIFSRARCDRLYTVRGGPGTGKSRFLREVAACAKKHGEDVTYYYCSSDPESLDGVYLAHSRTGLIDATAPHTWEPTLAGAFEQTVDLGAFWDPKGLLAQYDRIRSLTDRKSGTYATVYRLLRAMGEIDAAVAPVRISALKREKLEKKAARVAAGLSGAAGDTEVALCAGIGMKGAVRFDTYEKAGKTVCRVSDEFSLGHFYLEALMREGKRRSAAMRVSYDPIFSDRIDALEWIGDGRVFVLESDRDRCDVHMLRFVDDTRLRDIRPRLRGAIRQKKELEEWILREFSAAKESHFALEEIYGCAMDFSAKEAFTEEFCRRLF